MNEQQLVDLKKKIDLAKQKQSELKGKKKALLENLKTNFGCNTIAEAEKKASELEKEVSKLDADIEEGMKEIEENYEF